VGFYVEFVLVILKLLHFEVEYVFVKLQLDSRIPAILFIQLVLPSSCIVTQ
jgi:hypothetical protein